MSVRLCVHAHIICYVHTCVHVCVCVCLCLCLCACLHHLLCVYLCAVHLQMVSELEGQVAELREELVQANQLRKQQLVELGLLREEEKQKMQRDHEAEVGQG